MTDITPSQAEQPTTDTIAPQVLLLPAPVPAPIFSPPIRRMPTVPQLGIALGALALIFALSYLPIGADTRKHTQKTEYVIEQAPQDTEKGDDTDFFKEVRITADAAYVWDSKNQRALYNKNAGTQLPLASLTKLMTVLVAYEHLDPDARIPITERAVKQEGDSGLASGETFTLHDLANLTLITSSNDGAYALAATAGVVLDSDKDPIDAFIDAMNAKAEEIGLSQSYFTNPTGLDVDGATSGSYGSARDMAFLMEYFVSKHPDMLEGTKETASVIRNQEGAVFNAVNTNEVTDRISGIIGSKTGFTGLAGGNLVIAYDAGLNRPIIIAVLGSTREGRFTDVVTLIKETAQVIAHE